jgi:hypothetical protein
MDNAHQDKMAVLDRIIVMISLPEEVVTKVKAAFVGIELEEYAEEIGNLLDIRTAYSAWQCLKEKLISDPGNMKMLALMLYALSYTYEKYRSAGIDDDVFVATMGCFNRFLHEYHDGYEEWVFDRDWWTFRQTAMTVFRLGELEYEMKSIDIDRYISIHIPSDAVFLPEKVKASLLASRAFFRAHFPDYENVEYRCSSWLLSPALKTLLPPQSNILAFQSLFTLTGEDYSGSGYITWVYKRKYDDYRELPEETTLQRNLKQYLLSGEVLSVGKGVLKKELVFENENQPF